MATASVSSFVSVEEYLRNPEWERAEYVDGVIEERAMPEEDHAAWQVAICFWFSQNAELWRIKVRAEYRTKAAETRYRIPDVSIKDFDVPREPVAVTPHLAVFEIWSPEDRMRKMLIKLADYQKKGVPQIWTVDPADGVWQRFVDGRLIDQEIFAMPERGIEFSMNEITKLVR